MSDISDLLERRSIPEPNSGCILWLGAVVPRGYGKINIRGRFFYTHRLAWIEAYGPIPPKILVCHRCDVPSCINHKHLFLGTHKQNTADCIHKKRWRCILSLEEARVIRTSPASGRSLARHYGVSDSTISEIRRRLSWKEPDALAAIAAIEETQRRRAA